MILTPALHFISQACIYGGPCLHRHQAGVLREPELQSLQGARGDRAPPHTLKAHFTPVSSTHPLPFIHYTHPESVACLSAFVAWKTLAH